MATKAELAKAAAELKKTQAALAKQAKTPAPTTGAVPNFKPTVAMPTPAKKPGDAGFVGPVAAPAETQFIFNNQGLVEEVYTTGPNAGTSVSTGNVVIQGPKPADTTPARAELFNQLTSGYTFGGGSNTGKTTPGSSQFAGLTALLSSYGIDGIANMVDKIITDYPEADGEEILNLIRYDQRYNKPYMDRFAGNAIRMKNKLPMLDEATYLQQELSYSKIFKSYGLKNLDTREQYTKLIASDVSVDEVTSRVSLAYDRVLKADPTTTEAFRKFYPMLGASDLVSAMLDPEQQLPALERKVQAAEIGGAALRQGLSTSLMDTTATSAMYKNVQTGSLGAENLETAGVSASGASSGYGKIATELPTMEKLSSIYGPTMAQYGQKEAEQAQLLGLASAQRKKEALIAREEAQFKGESGVGPGAFSTQYLRRTSSSGQF